MARVICAVLAVFFVAACSGGSEAPPEYPPVDPDPVTTAEPASAQTTPPEPAEPPPPPVQVVAAERTPIEGAAPTLRIVSPRNGQTIRRGAVNLRLRLRNWELAEAPGKHVHVIVDNEPYIAVRDVSGNIDLGQLVQDNLGHELAAGTHVVRVFPSRGHHESVKEGTPFAMAVFHYQEQTEGFELDAEAPMLTYSRPKGCATLGERLLLDFYLSNVDTLAADGIRVRYAIDDVTGEITTWAPHYVENLTAGEHQIRLTLVGADGQPIAGPFNDTARTFTVAESCGGAPAPAADAEEREEEESEEEEAAGP